MFPFVNPDNLPTFADFSRLNQSRLVVARGYAFSQVDLPHIGGQVGGGLTDVGSLTGTRVASDDDTLLEDKSQCGGPVIGLDVIHHLPLEALHLHLEPHTRSIIAQSCPTITSLCRNDTMKAIPACSG